MLRINKSRGSAIVVVMMVVLVIAILGFALMSLSLLSTRFSYKFKNDTLAFEAAQAGVSDTIYEIVNSPCWSRGYQNVASVNSSEIWNSGFNLKPVTGEPANYSVSFNSPVPGTPYYSVNNITGVTAADGYFGPGTVPPGTCQIISVGRSFDGSGQRSKRVIFASVIPKPISIFPDFAVYAKRDITFASTVTTDSWDSSKGTYDGTRSDSEGSVGSNGDDGIALQINLGPSVIVNGDVMLAPDSNVSTSLVINSSSQINGDIKVSDERLNLPVLIPPTGPVDPQVKIHDTATVLNLAPGFYRSIKATNGVVSLRSGVYVFTEGAQFTAGSVLQVPAGEKAIVYTLANWDSSGQGMINSSQKPRNLLLIGAGSCTSINIAGSATTYMGVYAPGADVAYSGNADLYGEIVAKSFKHNSNGGVHHDIDLREAPLYSSVKMEVIAWQEL
ncbi:MAG: hypothetical protein M1269_02300 [Chloroflexi bacterium]|nr:hypothetical protein [Chloroflexota bacterium]